MTTLLHTRTIAASLLIVLTFLGQGCRLQDPGETRTFLLRRDTLDVAGLSDQLIEAIALHLESSGSLHEGYPILGEIVLEPDSSEPGVQIMHCAATDQVPVTGSRCMVLNEHGDFIKAESITWESAALHMYRVYIAPKAPFARVNPVKNFVALDVYLLQEYALWQAVDEAIKDAAAQIGARPFQP